VTSGQFFHHHQHTHTHTHSLPLHTPPPPSHRTEPNHTTPPAVSPGHREASVGRGRVPAIRPSVEGAGGDGAGHGGAWGGMMIDGRLRMCVGMEFGGHGGVSNSRRRAIDRSDLEIKPNEPYPEPNTPHTTISKPPRPHRCSRRACRRTRTTARSTRPSACSSPTWAASTPPGTRALFGSVCVSP
jgi:hypothetical protein